MTEVETIIKTVLKTGGYRLGSKSTLKSLRNGEAKAVIVASNCPEEVLEKIKSYDVKILVYNGTNMELGALCGKPFSVAAMAITEEI
ncbi:MULTISPECIES: 50S ribosomal protein L30e [Archaeoglobus]|jgi:large subunit ribosomal protein L30e|uniref:Large ribosomal subunit protein eL30 n=3 Tax=Archaeoglobus fulgidus TaxID=2234 RepID=RL30E_ARCFU|nr:MULTISPECIES: 50S ribosomal protein L30e [Archaeoglobus]O28389.1 RecName: Full=Large ribosomal subunit protein eL30; AltName: Full=50S ribosomal protein L30e [Archaeoglobus fulgidus DSM 4304]AAB89372.1 LSU ribosomal protein L30E (rpl30E) [Archaeoglobus fulgidus DSM 4304]AIG98885.1 Ribosomal protein L30E [Archaeoglobus fulgidus DSM 8774]KUJ93959.1 MAG: 50S ribosomal protein L30e [Archaeoglobus fulgidus]KUK07414.1 MAG: 50S ribosomal protein L30e [Archaeoglobus fulgidus]MDI3497769.1 large sub